MLVIKKLSSEGVYLTNRVDILHETVRVSYEANTIGKGRGPTIISPAIGEQ